MKMLFRSWFGDCALVIPLFFLFELSSLKDTEVDNQLKCVNNSCVNTFHRNIPYIIVSSRIILTTRPLIILTSHGLDITESHHGVLGIVRYYNHTCNVVRIKYYSEATVYTAGYSQ